MKVVELISGSIVLQSLKLVVIKSARKPVAGVGKEGARTSGGKDQEEHKSYRDRYRPSLT